MQSSKKENDFQYPLLYIFQYTINMLTLTSYSFVN